MDQLITAALDRLKSTIVNNNILEDDYNSGCESKDNNKIDISAKTTSDTIVKKKNASDLKIIE